LLEDYNPSVPFRFEELPKIDRMALMQLQDVSKSVRKNYEDFEFYKGINAINRWIKADLSAFYFESIKDRLYADGADTNSRRSAQYTLYHIYKHVTSMLAPVTPVLIEETWDYTPAKVKETATHPLRRVWPEERDQWRDDQLSSDMQYLFAANAAVKVAQEQARGDKKMGSSLQCFVVLAVEEGQSKSGNFALEIFQRFGTELESFFVVSGVAVCSGSPPTVVTEAEWCYDAEFEVTGQKVKAFVYTPQKKKCIRCWRYDGAYDVDEKDEDKMLCKRCESVTSKL